MTTEPLAAEAPAPVMDAAQWWAENNARYWRTRALLLAHVASEGPVRLLDGRLVGYMPDGNAWDGDGVAQVMPDLIKNGEVSFTGPLIVIERVLDMVLEEFAAIDFAVKRTVDATAANAVIRAGGEAADKLLPHRVAKNKLGVR